MKPIHFIISSLLSLALIACGGGGGGANNDGGNNDSNPPDTPAQFAAVSGDASVTLTWDAADDATTYHLYWSTSSGFDQGTQINSTTTTYTHTSLSNDTTYYYRVSASNSDGESERSSEISATPIAAPNSSSASTLSGTSQSQHANQQLVYNDEGVGLAVWQVDAGFGKKLVYSVYQANEWTTEQLLTAREGRSFTEMAFDIATNGSDFAVIYVLEGKLYSTIYTVGNGWSSTEELGSAEGEPNIASDGNGFVAAWTQYSESRRSAVAAIYSNGNWDSAALLENDDENHVSNIRVASDGIGYMVVWQQLDASERQGGSTPEGLIYNLYNGSNWSGAQLDLEFSVQDATDPELVGYSDGFAVIWEQTGALSTDNITVNRHSGAGGGSWAGSEDIASGSDGLSSPKLVAFNNQLMAIWEQGDGNENMLYASLYTDSWSTPEVIGDEVADSSSYQATLATNGSEVAATWLEDEALAGPNRVYARLYDGSWSDATLLENSDSSASNPQPVDDNGSNFTISWTQNDGSKDAIFISSHNDSGATSPDNLVQGTHVGGSATPQLASNSNGTLAVWSQWVEGDYQIHASFDDGSGWGTPFYVGDGYAPVVAANQSGEFMIVWKNGYNYARAFDGNALGEEVTVADTCDTCSAAGEPQIASNGSGYAIAFTQGNGSETGVYVNLFEDGGWNGATFLEAGANSPHISTNGNGYGVVWTEDIENGRSVFVSLYDGSLWSSSENLIDANFDDIVDYPRIAGNNNGYAVVWDQHGDVGFSLYENQTWSSATLLESDANTSSSRPDIASDGSGYGIVWNAYKSQSGSRSLYGQTYSNNTWDSVTYLGASASDAVPRIASGTSGQYGVVWKSGSSDDSNISANLFQSGHWQSAATIESQSGSCDDAQIVFDGSSYQALWSYTTAADPVSPVIRESNVSAP